LQKFYRDTSALEVAAKPKPHTNFEGGDYKGSTGEARGVLAILEMLQEDIRKQIKTEGQDEIDAQKAYEEQAATLVLNQRALGSAKAQAESEKAELATKKADQQGDKLSAQTDIADETDIKAAIATDCDWVKTQFELRRTQRKDEITGLNEASEFLSQAGGPADLSLDP